MASWGEGHSTVWYYEGRAMGLYGTMMGRAMGLYGTMRGSVMRLYGTIRGGP